jgi:CDGSH-type Zn-finger protein
MEKAVVADNTPHILELESGKTYAWCACGKSANQPWCDGSHQGSSFSPKVFTVDETKKAAMCMCKQTKNPPYCDGSHMSLED